MTLFRYTAAALLAAGFAAPLHAQPAPTTGARPGNEIGTGQSLPRGDSASNINGGDTRSTIAPNLPTPPVAPSASPHDYLVAARGAIAAGRTGEGQQALEMAETRALDRSVPYAGTGVPSGNPFVAQIGQALQALAAGDRGRAITLIDAALAMPAAQ